jgi:hypothetical protein
MSRSPSNPLSQATQRLKRFEHPYIGDLINILRKYPSGAPRRRVLELLERQRTQDGLPIPEAFEEAVQNSYNRYARGYSEFEKNKEPGEEPLFFSPHGKGRGQWAVSEDAAVAWLARHIPPFEL